LETRRADLDSFGISVCRKLQSLGSVDFASCILEYQQRSSSGLPMASKVPARSFRAISNFTSSRAGCSYTSARCAGSPHSSSRNLSSSASQKSEDSEPIPRYKQTPGYYKAPFRLRPLTTPYAVNEDPEVLDKMYNTLLGVGGSELLSDEVKWLAVTHKTFDHGKRGYNDRLAFLGTLS
jgi:large subunit ribosomal protein L15